MCEPIGKLSNSPTYILANFHVNISINFQFCQSVAKSIIAHIESSFKRELYRRQAGHWNIVFDIPMRLLGAAPIPGLTAFTSSRTRLRRGFMLRMTSREKIMSQRNGIAAMRCKGVSPWTERSDAGHLGRYLASVPKRQFRRTHEYAPAGAYRSAPFLAGAPNGLHCW